MANRCYLIKKRTNNFQEEGENISLAKNYTIPLYWLALFNKDYLFYRDINMMDGSVEQWPTLITETQNAITEFEQKKEKLLALISDEYYYLYDLFLEMLKNSNEKYIQVEIDEIRCMSFDITKFDDDLVSTLNELNNEFDLYKQTFINEVVGFNIDERTGKLSKHEKDEIIYGLCGYGWGCTPPWEN